MPVSSDFRFATSSSQVAKNMTRRGRPGPSVTVPPWGPADGSVKAAARSRYRDALRHRDLRLLIGAFLVDQIGSWSYVVVISVYVFDRTHSTQWLAATGVCRWAPGLLLTSYGGVIADRYQRTTVMTVSALASAAIRSSRSHLDDGLLEGLIRPVHRVAPHVVLRGEVGSSIPPASLT